MTEEELCVKECLEEYEATFDLDANLEEMVIQRIELVENNKARIMKAKKNASVGMKISAAFGGLFILNYSFVSIDGSMIWISIVSIILFMLVIIGLIWSKLTFRSKFDSGLSA